MHTYLLINVEQTNPNVKLVCEENLHHYLFWLPLNWYVPYTHAGMSIILVNELT